MFGIVLKFHSQTTSVEGVITIPVIILKQHAACCFIGLTMNNNSTMCTYYYAHHAIPVHMHNEI